MKTSIRNIIALMFLVATFISCNQNSSLQTYYVDNELKPGFTSVDIPTSFLKIDETTLTDEQKKAYKSIDKLNMLAFVINEDNKEQYKEELTKINSILKDSKYNELMRAGNSVDGKFVMKYIGDDDEVDEFILFGNANDKGFAVIRILGDDMNPNQIASLAQGINLSDIDASEVQQFAEMFK